MDLKKKHNLVLKALEESKDIENICNITGYKEKTVKSALNDLKNWVLIDDNLNKVETVVEIEEPEDAAKIVVDVENVDGDEDKIKIKVEVVQHLRKLDFLNVSKKQNFTFHNKAFVVEEIIDQKTINNKPYLKMIAASGEEKVLFTINLDRDKAPIAFKKIEE